VLYKIIEVRVIDWFLIAYLIRIMLRIKNINPYSTFVNEVLNYDLLFQATILIE